jgi:predicted NAD/FAD-binding protein
VMACHSDQASQIVKTQSAAQRLVLDSVAYQTNIAVLHNDEALMPKRKAAWSSWNYLGEQRDGTDPSVSVTYWMNSLQNLNTQTNYFVTLNPVLEPDSSKVLQRIEYAHPVFDSDSESRLKALPLVQGENHLWFAGAWTGYGFHEDGMRSGVEVAHAISGGKALDKAWLDALIASRDLIKQKKDKAAA